MLFQSYTGANINMTNQYIRADILEVARALGFGDSITQTKLPDGSTQYSIDVTRIPIDMTGFKNLSSFTVSTIPVVGDVKDLQEAVMGVDLITGARLTPGERVVTAVCVFLPVISGKEVRVLRKGFIKSGTKLVAEAVSKIKYGLRNISYTDEVIKSADEINAFWKSNNYINPPYKADIPVSQIRLTQNTNFVKVYDGVTSNEYGQFVMKLEDITNADGSFMTALQIKDKYALEFLPKFVADANIPVGTTMNCGIAGPIQGWGSGGGLQFDLNFQKVGSFKYRATLGN
jgi:hypothetical protein